MQPLEHSSRHPRLCGPLPCPSSQPRPARPWELGSLAWKVRNSPGQEALLSEGVVDVDEKQSCAGWRRWGGGGLLLKTCPMDWVVGGLLHPVPKGNMFESFVVASQAVWLDGSGGFILAEKQSHRWLGIPGLIRAYLSWVSPSHPSHFTALNYHSANGCRDRLWFLPSTF